MFERFIFKKIEVWIVMLVLTIAIPAILVFGWVVQYKALGGKRGGFVADLLLDVAEFPDPGIRFLVFWRGGIAAAANFL